MNTQRFTFFQRVPRVFGMPRRCPGDWLAIVFARHCFVMRIVMGWKGNGEIPDPFGIPGHIMNSLATMKQHD